MPTYSTPGVYIEEIEIGAKPIEGVSTSTAGFLGLAEKGPTIGKPQFISSFSEFQSIFGNYLSSDYGQYRFLAQAINNFFINGGSGCYVMRVAPSDASQAGDDAVSIVPVLQLAGDIKAADLSLQFESIMFLDSKCKLVIEDQDPTDPTKWVKNEVDLIIASYDPSKSTVTLDKTTPLAADHKLATTRVTVKNLPSASATATVTFSATSVGDWGNKLLLRSLPVSQAKTMISSVVGDATKSAQYQLKSKNGFYAGGIVVFDSGTTKQYAQVQSIQGDVVMLSGHLSGDADVVGSGVHPERTLLTCEFRLEVYLIEDALKQGQTVQVANLKETFNNVSLNPNVNNYFGKMVNNVSNYVNLSWPDAQAAILMTDASGATNPFMMPENDTLRDGVWYIALQNGSDGNSSKVTSADFEGNDGGPGKRTGLQAFQEVDNVSIMAIPGVTDPEALKNLTAFCDNYKDRFAVLDAPPNSQQISDVLTFRDNFDTSYAALYHPWIKVYDPIDNADIFIPPSGSVMGVYARTDNDKGVFKAPANETVQNTTELKYLINNADQGILNPKGVNCIRAFTGRGIRVWGARTCSSDPLWQYINVRRLFIFLEQSIEQGTQWVVFEPNNEKLWARVIQTISQFLTTQWKSGALMGTTPDQAFFVKCDRTTMTQDDIDNGRLVVLVGVAATKPAEFVIFRIAQWQGGSAATE